MEVVQGSELRMNNRVEDPLKSLDELFEIDRPFVSGSIEDSHSVLSSINLSENVPVDVRQLFETAKNVALYSRFAYRFHQVAEMVSFSALEFSLKELLSTNYPDERLPTGIGQLLKRTKNKGIFQNDFFGENLNTATENGIRRELSEKAKKEEAQFGAPIVDPNREITRKELEEGIKRSVAVDGYIKVLLGLRNDLAHGSGSLSPTGFLSLRRRAELINYLYAKSKSIDMEEVV